MQVLQISGKVRGDVMQWLTCSLIDLFELPFCVVPPSTTVSTWGNT